MAARQSDCALLDGPTRDFNLMARAGGGAACGACARRTRRVRGRHACVALYTHGPAPQSPLRWQRAGRARARSGLAHAGRGRRGQLAGERRALDGGRAMSRAALDPLPRRDDAGRRGAALRPDRGRGARRRRRAHRLGRPARASCRPTCARAATRRTTRGGALVTPGLIDCHTHLVYGGDRAARVRAAPERRELRGDRARRRRHRLHRARHARRRAKPSCWRRACRGCARCWPKA